jgi:HlyD family secretion protein
MKTRNAVILAVAAAAVAATVAWALRPRALPAESAAVTQGVFEQTISDDGRTRVRERYVVSAPLAGRIERIALDEGDAVRQGDVLAVLAPTAPALLDARTTRELSARVAVAQARLAAGKAQTARAVAQRDHAQAGLERQTRLAAQKFVSETMREDAVLELRTAERALEAARFSATAAAHEVEQARAALARYQSGDAGAKWAVTSPVTGAVLKVVQKSEGAVALGAPLLEIADPRALEAVVDILSQDAVAVRPGMPARVELGRGVPPLAARVRRVEPAAFTKVSALGVEEQRVNVILDFDAALDRIASLGDGYRVEAAIVVERVEAAVKVPVGALFRDGERWALFAVQDGRARKRHVEVLARNPLEARVGGGVAAGEQVVVYPSDAMSDGSRLDLRAAAAR